MSLLDYCITSNHVHLTLCAEEPDDISGLMQRVAGGMAQNYNLRKERHGAFWDDRYHATVIERGEHFMRCLGYVALQMIRCGAVEHPRQWDWCGYQELAGLRQRYRLIDQERLLELLNGADPQEFRRHYVAMIEDSIAKARFQREAQWTQCIAVGSETFVHGMARQIQGRQELEVGRAGEAWVIRETPPAFA